MKSNKTVRLFKMARVVTSGASPTDIGPASPGAPVERRTRPIGSSRSVSGRRRGAYANLAVLAGHSTIRTAVMGEAASQRQEATPEELARMKAMVADAMDQGAIGLGAGVGRGLDSAKQTTETDAITSGGNVTPDVPITEVEPYK